MTIHPYNGGVFQPSQPAKPTKKPTPAPSPLTEKVKNTSENLSTFRPRSNAIAPLLDHEISYHKNLNRMTESMKGVIEKFKELPIKEDKGKNFSKDIHIALHRLNDLVHLSEKNHFETEEQMKVQLKKDTLKIYKIQTTLEDRYNEYYK